MAQQPSYYIVCPDTVTRWTAAGELVHQPNIVPLIPVDLPSDYIDLEGVARHLSFADTAGMTNLGNMAAPGNQYRVSFSLPRSEDYDERDRDETGHGIVTSVTPRSTCNARVYGHDKLNLKGDESPITSPQNDLEGSQDNRHPSTASIRNDLAASRHNPSNTPTAPVSEVSPTIKDSPSNGTTPVNNISPFNESAPINEAPPPAPTSQTSKPSEAKSSAPHVTERKVKQQRLCAHWIHNGWCAFDDCSKKHRMPTTTKTLKAVGLQGWPQWMINYMHTEQLPAPPPQKTRKSTAGSARNSSRGGEVGRGDSLNGQRFREAFMFPEVAKRRQDGREKVVSATKAASAKTSKTLGQKGAEAEDAKAEDLIDLL